MSEPKANPNPSTNRAEGKRALRVHVSAWTLIVVAVACTAIVQSEVWGQLRIVTYNTANGTFPSGNDPNPRTGMDLVLQAIGDEVTNGFARPIDVLIFQEHDDPSTTTQDFVDLLDGIYGAGTYAHSTVITLPNFALNIRQTMIYNTNTLTLIDEKAFGTTGSSAAARQSSRYQLRPVGYDASADFYVYNDHYKASTGATNEARRDFEANTVRNDSDALGQGTHAIYAGDFNIRTSSEAMYQTLLSAGNGQAFDPISTPGNWNNNAAFAAVHTQSPHDGSDGLTTFGMDDRFDFQLVTGEFLDNEGLSYISGSYHAFGNNGTTFNVAINNGSNTYPLTNAQLDALAHVSDHLPVVVDYQLPAKMTASVAPVAGSVIVGATLNADVTVENTASVVHVLGADELDYAISGSGAVTGSDSGIDPALGGGNVHAIALDTATAGAKSGQVDVTSSSQAAANSVFADNVAYNVLDHSEGSFNSLSNIDFLNIDFGTIALGSGVQSQLTSLFNLEAAVGFTAALDLDSLLGTGDIATLTTDLTTFSGLAAGGEQQFNVMLDTSTIGTFNATYFLGVSDENLSGATNGTTLTLQLSGEVFNALPQDTWDGGGADDNWTTGANWLDNTAPNPAATGALVFDGAVRLTPNADVPHSGVESIDFAATAGAFTLGGSNLTFTGAATVTNLSGNTQTINNNLVIGGASLLLTANTGSLIVGGVISGAGGLTKAGAAAVRLSGANTYTGPTTINAGNLQLVGGNAVPDTSAVTLANVAGAQLQLAGGDETIGSLAGGGALGGNVSLLGGNTLTVGDATSTTYAGVISGTSPLALTKVGTGTLELAGANTYTGRTTINAGTLALTGGAALADTSGVFIANVAGATLLLNNDETIGSLTGGGGAGGTVDLNSNTLTVGGNGQSTLFSGTIININGKLVKEGAGTLTLRGNNTYVGGTTLNAGTLALGHDNALGTGLFTINAGAVLADTAVVPGPRTIANAVVVGGDFTVSGSEVMTFAGTMDLGGATRTITTTNTGTTTISGVISGAGGTGLTKAGTQSLRLSGVNTYTGATTINAGTLTLLGGSVLVDTVAVILADVAATNLFLNSSETIGSLAGGGATGGNVILTTNTLTVGDANSTTYAGVISGAGGSLTKLGTGTLTLSGMNTLTGDTNINFGSIRLNGSVAGDVNV
ncbi:MAG: autotransporter-associated beta strand repeat-containing protein, partial [Phycisphaeraceae bacterium]